MQTALAREQAITLARAISGRRGVLLDAMLVVSFSLLTALAARIVIPLPFTPVPVTGQTLAVLLAGAALGSRLGLASQLLYVVIGVAGLPVFYGGKSGLSQLMGPTGGYLAGFVIAAFMVGLLSELRWDRNPIRAAATMVAGNAVIYAAGVPWLAAVLGVGLGKALALGLYPFLVGDLFKLLVASAVLPGAWLLLRRKQR